VAGSCGGHTGAVFFQVWGLSRAMAPKAKPSGAAADVEYCRKETLKAAAKAAALQLKQARAQAKAEKEHLAKQERQAAVQKAYLAASDRAKALEDSPTVTIPHSKMGGYRPP
jgi:hypothetical protein